MNGENEINLQEGEPNFTLYWIHGSISSMRVLFLLHEENLQHVALRMKIMKKDGNQKDTRKPEFLQLNHRGKCPVFVDSTNQKKLVMNESLAILRYIDRIHLQEKYSGIGTEYYPSILIKIEETQSLQDAYEPLEELFENLRHVDRKKMMKAYAKLQKEYAYWEKYAQENEYIAAPFLSLADFAFFPILEYIKYRGFEIDAVNFPQLSAYYERVKTEHSKGRNGAFPFEWVKKEKNKSNRNLYTRYQSLLNTPLKINKPYPPPSRKTKPHQKLPIVDLLGDDDIDGGEGGIFDMYNENTTPNNNNNNNNNDENRECKVIEM